MKKIIEEREQFPLKYSWRLTAYYKGTKRIFKILEGENLIVAIGKTLVGDMLIDRDAYDTGLTYCALGDTATAPADGDTTLANEGGNGGGMRKTITSKTRAANVITLSTFFASNECILAILEAGIFGHSSANGDKDSGILFSRWLVAFDNSGDDYDITIDYVLTIG